MFSSGAADLFSALIIFLHQDFTVHTSILIDDFFFQRNNAVEKTRHFLLSKLSKVVCCLKYGVKINDDVERKFFSGKRSVEK